MDHIVRQLEDVRKPGKIETKDSKVINVSILSTKPKWKVSSKRKMSYQLVDEFRVVSLQNYKLDEKLNQLKLISVTAKYKESYQDILLNIINIALL